MPPQPHPTSWRKRLLYLSGASIAALATYHLYTNSPGRTDDKPSAAKPEPSTSKHPPPSTSDEAFKQATTTARSLSNISVEDQLELYALFKQASGEKLPKSRPSLIDMRGRAKYDAWAKVSDLSIESSQAKYIAMVARLHGASSSLSSSSPSGSGSEKPKVLNASASPMGKVVSVLETLGSPGKSWLGEENEPSYLAKHGNSRKLEALARADPTIVSKRDSEGLAAIHWACDNGSLSMVKTLVGLGCNVDLKDGEGLTPLAYAVINEHVELAKYLVKQGADVQAKDNQGECVMQMASDSPEMQRVLQAI